MNKYILILVAVSTAGILVYQNQQITVSQIPPNEYIGLWVDLPDIDVANLKNALSALDGRQVYAFISPRTNLKNSEALSQYKWLKWIEVVAPEDKDRRFELMMPDKSADYAIVTITK